MRRRLDAATRQRGDAAELRRGIAARSLTISHNITLFAS
jgi:hypothetical protein